MKRIVIVLLALIAGALRAADAPALPPLPQTIGPYLQNPAPDGVTAMFLTRTKGDVTVLSGSATCRVVSAAIPGTPWTVHKARIALLTPGKEQAYRIMQKDGDRTIADVSASFATPDPAAESIRLIALNDIHNRLPTLEALMKQVKPEDYERALLLGDCWTDPSPANGADFVFRTLDGYVRLLDAAHKPMILVRGNHETRGAFTGRLAYLFDIPGLDAAQKPDDQQWNFSFVDGPVFFAALDTGEDDDFGTDPTSYKRPKFWQGYRQRQSPWLKQVVASPAATGAVWRVFLSHIPLYNPAGWNSEPARIYWEPILKDARIDLMLAGHDHGWKLVPEGKDIVRATKQKDGTSTTVRQKPISPVLIGGGPSLKEGTVMLLTADRQKLHVRLLDVNGRLLTEVAKP